jgi:DNA-binding protein WhiA
MSFAAGVKEELAGLPPGNACCRRSELAGIVLSAGSLHLKAGGLQAEVSTESAAIARRVYKMIKSLYAVQPSMEQHERHRLRSIFSYRVVISQDGAARRMLEDVGILGDDGMTAGVKPDLVRLSCCEGAFMRGLFLGCGSMSDPGKSYHLELVLGDEQLARSAAALLAGAEITARVALRSGKHVIYIKEADHISEFLAMTGAHAQMLQFESIRVEKGVRNTVNRVVNCDTANLDKALRASLAQVDNILLIDRHGGLVRLPPSLRDTAQARLDNPDATLERLSELMGGVSKSGLNHRFHKIAEMAEEIRAKEGLSDDT